MEKDKPKTVIDLKGSRFVRDFNSSELIHNYEYMIALINKQL